MALKISGTEVEAAQHWASPQRRNSRQDCCPWHASARDETPGLCCTCNVLDGLHVRYLLSIRFRMLYGARHERHHEDPPHAARMGLRNVFSKSCSLARLTAPCLEACTLSSSTQRINNGISFASRKAAEDGLSTTCPELLVRVYM